MVEWLVVWGATQAVGLAFKPILEDLAKDAAKDWVKDMFKGCLSNVIKLPEKEPLVIELEKNNLKYLGGLAKNRKVSLENLSKNWDETRLAKLAESLPQEDFTKIELKLDKPRTVWVTTKKVLLSQLEGIRTIAEAARS